jgi:hypothetical protein
LVMPFNFIRNSCIDLYNLGSIWGAGPLVIESFGRGKQEFGAPLRCIRKRGDRGRTSQLPEMWP